VEQNSRIDGRQAEYFRVEAVPHDTRAQVLPLPTLLHYRSGKCAVPWFTGAEMQRELTAGMRPLVDTLWLRGRFRDAADPGSAIGRLVREG